MPYYLVSFIERLRGIETSFYPRTDQSRFKVLDLRPDPSILTGRGLLWVPNAETITGARFLGDHKDDRSNAVRNALESELGITLESNILSEIIASVFMNHGRTDGSRWRPLLPTLNGFYRIVLDQVIWQQAVIRGGSQLYTESFNQADSTTLGPDLTWTETAGNLQTVSNRVRPVSNNQISEGRAEHDLDTINIATQIFVPTGGLPTPASSVTRIQAVARFASAARTYYGHNCECDTAGVILSEINKRVTGTQTVLSSGVDVSSTFAAGTVTVELRTDGSLLRSILNSSQIEEITDTSIATGTRGGILMVQQASAVPLGDNFITYDWPILESLATAARLNNPGMIGRRYV